MARNAYAAPQGQRFGDHLFCSLFMFDKVLELREATKEASCFAEPQSDVESSIGGNVLISERQWPSVRSSWKAFLWSASKIPLHVSTRS